MPSVTSDAECDEMTSDAECDQMKRSEQGGSA
jgi:hypothetical protein